MKLYKSTHMDTKRRIWWDALVEQRAPDGRLAAAMSRFSPELDRRTIAMRIRADRWSVRKLIEVDGQAR